MQLPDPDVEILPVASSRKRGAAAKRSEEWAAGALATEGQSSGMAHVGGAGLPGPGALGTIPVEQEVEEPAVELESAVDRGAPPRKRGRPPHNTAVPLAAPSRGHLPPLPAAPPSNAAPAAIFKKTTTNGQSPSVHSRAASVQKAAAPIVLAEKEVAEEEAAEHVAAEADGGGRWHRGARRANAQVVASACALRDKHDMLDSEPAAPLGRPGPISFRVGSLVRVLFDDGVKYLGKLIRPLP